MYKNLKSEIINQKKQFIFNVDQTSDYVYPDEVYKYYIYIKNTSGVDLENFTIKIEKPDEIYIKSAVPEIEQNLTIHSNDVKLYEIKARCAEPGEYYVHFLAYGDGTRLAYKMLKITSNRSYNSDKLIHYIHFYDFNPYESKFSMEADNYSEEVTQTFKRQKLPYKAKKQPFKLRKNKYYDTQEKKWKIDEHFITENQESQSFLEQYTEAKNTNEHVYQYLSRENFTQDATESYSGRNLYEIIKKINNNSKYFNATFLRTGTNHLLTDLTRYEPNGFIYRMGLLSSELYHTLGVLPTYTYMNDKLFRWAPSPSGQHLFMNYEADFELLDLYPKPKAMEWGKNIWAGRGWIVYKVITEDYMATEEFQKKLQDNLINIREKVNSFEHKRDAEQYIEQQLFYDNVVRNQQQSDLIKYRYEMEESLYDTGVFFVNIPINKIPSNFYLTETEDLYAIINRVKPFGMKPIINYIVEKEFNLNIEQKLIPNYHQKAIYNLEDPDVKYQISEEEIINEQITCNNETITVPKKKPKHIVLYNNDFNMDTDLKASPKITINLSKDNATELSLDQSFSGYSNRLEQSLINLESITEILYKNNYNNISFYLDKVIFSKLSLDHSKTLTFKEDQSGFLLTDGTTTTENNFDSIKLHLYHEKDIKENDGISTLSIKDSFDKIHNFNIKYDSYENMYHIQYVYQNTKGKQTIKKEGLEKVIGLIVGFLTFNNRKIILFCLEDSNQKIHYFYHTIVENIQSIKTLYNGEEVDDILYYRRNLKDENVIFETPFCYNIEKYKPKLIEKGENWEKLYRIDEKESTRAYIQNSNLEYITPNDIILYYDNINIPETSIVKNMKFTITGNTNKDGKIYLSSAINTNYRNENLKGNSLQVRPKIFEVYPQSNESSTFYQIKLEKAIQNNQETYIKKLQNLIQENMIFNEDLKIKMDYLKNSNDYITISRSHWCELSDFIDAEYNLNNVEKLSFVIEGYNSGDEVEMIAHTLSEVNQSSPVKVIIPAGYFYKKINLLYPNQFLIGLLRIKFRFIGLNRPIKIFNTAMDIQFKNKEIEPIEYDFVDEEILQGKNTFNILTNYINPVDLNNGVSIKLSFDDLNPGSFYDISSIKLEIIYQDTDIEMMVNKSKYRYIPTGSSYSSIQGITEDAYLSGEFYNDVATVSQIKSNIGPENKGIRLQDAIFQSFEAKSTNITSIELFPNGFIGNPDESIKIGLYTNNNNTPNKLIKEIYANGWTKTNDELKGLPSIKYNLNIDNLELNQQYWFKIEVLNPQENSYYILKSINETLPRHRLLSRENNNYINTFSSLTFNIYSKNLSESFRDIPAIQEFFDNPYILIGLHKGQGIIKKLMINKWDSDFKEEKSMKECFKGEPEQLLIGETKQVVLGITANKNGQKYKANFNEKKWDSVNDG